MVASMGIIHSAEADEVEIFELSKFKKFWFFIIYCSFPFSENLILDEGQLYLIHKDSDGSYDEGQEYNGKEFLILANKRGSSKFILYFFH